jgi:DNA adenine methylase
VKNKVESMNTSGDMSAVRPVRPAAGYIGGKRNLAARLVPMIDAIECRAYAEPFVGMGGIFLRRRRRPTAEFINDRSGDVTTFFRVVREHYGFFMESMRGLVSSRAEFDRQMKLPPEQLTDIQRSIRFLYVQRLAFGGKVEGRNFGVSPLQAARFNVLRLERDIADLHERLSAVVIEQLDFAAFIKRYDTPDTLFYLDPPYWGSETDYGADAFQRSDFDRLAMLLRQLRGRFIMSINDRAEVRQAFDGFAIAPVSLTYSVGAKPTTAKELIITPAPQ